MTDSVVNLVREVGQSLVSWRERGGADGIWEGTQFHANADRWAHRRLSDGLAGLRAGIPVVSEEDISRESTSAAHRYWLIDPIDGTASYAGGFAGYVTQVALMENDVPHMAVVYAPHSQELFVAERGSGSFLNGARLPVASSSLLTLIDNDPTPRGFVADLYEALSFTRYIECGSIGLKICRVAEGTADLFVKTVPVRDWDLAAPHLVLEEAGGCLFDALGRDISYGEPRKHEGLVAAKERELACRVVSWRRERGTGADAILS